MAIAPGVAAGAFEIEAVAGAEVMEFVAVEHQFDAPRQHMHELFALVFVGTVRGGAGRQHEAVAIHHVAPVREHLHGDAGRGLGPKLPFARPHDGAVVVLFLARQFRDRRAVIFGEIVQHAKGHALRGALEGRENRGRDADIAGDLLQCLAGIVPQAAQLAPDALRRIAFGGMCVDGGIFRIESFADGGRVQAAFGAIPGDALQPGDVVAAILPVASLRASGHDKPLRLPEPERRG